MENAAELQRRLYAESAATYDALHDSVDREHLMALSCLSGLIDFIGCSTLLDVGAGTGRSMLYLRARHPAMRIHGVEPVDELRTIAYGKGVAPGELAEGDATALHFADSSFDLVCAFGILHHIKDHRRAVEEMLRVAKKAVFISDSNRFGQGSPAARFCKIALWHLGLWNFFDFLKTRGKGYTVTPGDGLAYSYSLFDDLPAIRRGSQSVHFFTTRTTGPSLYPQASHLALLALK